MFKKHSEGGPGGGANPGPGAADRDTGLLADKAHVKKRPAPEKKRRDFTLNAAGLGLLLIAGLFILIGLSLGGGFPSPMEMGLLLGLPALTVLCMVLFPRWAAAVKIFILLSSAAGAGGAGYIPGPDFPYGLSLLFAALAILIVPSVQKLSEWERAIVLRFGRFHRVKGPGLFVLFPLADRVARTVDLRIRVTDFSA
ncbi:MAG: hypothetical protein LBG10_09510, partial [Treponema sp.]|nr:hypothetical protein [Treponema sp.]